jgi:hypothetical protein
MFHALAKLVPENESDTKPVQRIAPTRNTAGRRTAQALMPRQGPHNSTYPLVASRRLVDAQT